MPLSQKSGFKANLVSFGDQTGKRRRGRGEEKEEEEEKFKQSSIKVWKLTLIMNPMRFGMDPWFCRIIIFPKLGVLLGFHLNPKMIASKVGKTPYDARIS